MEQTSQWGEQDLTVAGTKAAVQKNEGENSSADAPIEGFATTYIPVEYSLQVSFSQNLVEDDRLGLVHGTYRGLGLSMYQTRQIVGFNVLNNGFTDTGPDAASLFNSSHTMIGGHTYGNRPSSDISLSIAGLREMEVDLMRQVNHRNINIAVMPQVLVVPPELSHTAKELIKSQDRPDTDNRSTNVHYGLYKIVVSPFLTSATAWLKFLDRIAPETDTWQDKSSGDVNTKIRARFVAKYSDFIGAWGTTG
jgi:phage major head subunit gpT-like protein